MAENPLQLFPHVWGYFTVFRENLGRDCSNSTIWQSTIEYLEKRIRQSPDDKLRRLWVEHHGLCTSWSILIALMFFDDPNTIYFSNDGKHRLAYTSHGLVIDSLVRIPVLLKGDKAYIKGGIEYRMLTVEGQQPLLSYTVCLLSYTHELLTIRC